MSLFPFFYSRLKLLINNAFPYIKDCSKVHKFYNTCVPDSFLAALHTSYLKYSKIEALLKSDDHLRKVMSLFNEKKYNEARELFVNKLNPSTDDLHSNVKDYFPLIDQLVRAKILFTDEPPSDKPIFRYEYKHVQSKCHYHYKIINTSSLMEK